MHSILIVISFIFSCSLAFPQNKVKVTKDTVYINDVKEFVIISEEMGNLYKVRNLDGQLLLTFMYRRYYDPALASNSNKRGSLTYIEATFIDSGQKCEFQGGMGKKYFARQIIKNELITDGKVNPTGENNFVKMHGNRFSQRTNVNININTR